MAGQTFEGRGRKEYDIFVFGFTFLLILSVIVSPDQEYSLNTAIFYFSLPILYLFSRRMMCFKLVDLFFKAFSVCIVIAAVFYLMQQISASHIFVLGLSDNKPTGTFMNVNNLGVALVCALPVATHYCIHVKKVYARLLWILITFFEIAMLVIVRTRAAWIAGCIVLLVMFIIHLRSKKARKVVIGSVCVLIALAIGICFVQKIDMFSYLDHSLAHRILIWKTALMALSKKWIWGIGFARYGIEHVPFIREVIMNSQTIVRNMSFEQTTDGLALFVHNDFLEWWLNLGFAGALLYMLLVYLIIRSVLVYAQEKNTQWLGSMSLLSIMICGIFHSSTFQPTTAAFLFICLGIQSTGRKAKCYSLVRRKSVVYACACSLIMLLFALKPFMADVYFFKAYHKNKQGQPAQAISNYQKSLWWNRASYLTYLNLSNVYLQQREFLGAEDYALKAIAEHPHSANAYNTLAVIYFSMGQFPLAEKNFEKALSLNPNLIGVLFNYAHMMALKGNVQKAYALMKKAHQIDPHDREIENYLKRLESALTTHP